MDATDARQPRLLQVLRAHCGEVTCAEASGEWLATGAGDRALRLWRWVPGAGWREAATARAAHRYGVTALRWSAGGAALASGGLDGCVRLWAGRSLAPRRQLAAPGAEGVRALCWAGGAGGGRLLAGHDDGALRVWDARRGRLEAELHAHDGALHAVAAPLRAALLLTACSRGVLKVFDLAEVCRAGRLGLAAPAPLLWEDGAHDMGALCAASDGAGGALATGGQDARVRLWAAERGGVRADGALLGHAAPVSALHWAGGVLASGALDGSARLWAPAARLCLRELPAHARYLTCVQLDARLRFLLTGSNDRTVRVWALGALELSDELRPPCAAGAHFGVGDLEGIGAVETDDLVDSEAEAAPGASEGEAGASAARLVWSSRELHPAAINCISAHGALLATASSDGVVRLLHWEGVGAPHLVRSLHAHGYPALAAELGAAGALLLSAGLDARACLHDAQSGVRLRTLSMPYSEGGPEGGEAGGGGVRGARLSPHRPPLLLLATDDGLAPLWSLATGDPDPLHVYGSFGEALTCCAWARDGRTAAVGAAGGALRLLAAPPAAGLLLHRQLAHDLGVQSCDFAGASAALGLEEHEHLLATTGCDSTLKLWLVARIEGEAAGVREVQSVAAHGGGAPTVRWGGGDGALLATAGADRWARVWRAGRGGATLTALAAVPAPGAGGALAVALVAPALLAVGAMDGQLALWRLARGGEDAEEDDAEGAEPRFWAEAGVERWLREYVTRAPGLDVPARLEAALVGRVRAAQLSGARLLDDPVEALLEVFGCGAEDPYTIAEDDFLASTASAEEGEGGGDAGCEVSAALAERLADELRWLRTELPAHAEPHAPHALRCPLTHRVAREPARAADGYTYERASLLEWLLVNEGVSPMSGRRLSSQRVAPNMGARAELRRYLQSAAAAETASEPP